MSSVASDAASPATGKRIRAGSGTSSEEAAGPCVQLYTNEEGRKRRIVFPETFDTRDLRLMEIPNDLLETIMKGGEVKIVGDTSKTDAVLCSSECTYSIRKVETSNQIYLVPPSATGAFQLEAGINEYYEIKPIAGRISSIKDLLQSHQYEGVDEEIHKDKGLFLTRDELWDRIQASDSEMNAALEALGVVPLGGYLRMISPPAANAVCRDLLDSAIVGSWDLSCLQEPDILAAMPGTDTVLLSHVLSKLGAKNTASSSGAAVWTLDAEKVARKTAHMVFENRESGGNVNDPWPVQDFIGEWGARTPGLKKNPESLLAGIAIVIRDEAHRTVEKKTCFRYMPAEQVKLASTIQERLKSLFAIKPKYELEELVPYVNDLAGGAGQPKSHVELLIAHSRLVDAKYYMSK